MYNANRTAKQVEDKLNALIKKYHIKEKITVDEIKKWIWNAKGQAMEALNQCHKKCFQLFPELKDIDEMNDVMQAFTDAWNFFPHKELGGKAPNELLKEGMKNVPKSGTEDSKMPKNLLRNGLRATHCRNMKNITMLPIFFLKESCVSVLWHLREFDRILFKKNSQTGGRHM